MTRLVAVAACALGLCWGSAATAQDRVGRDDPDDHAARERSTVYVEGLGAGLFYSVNYERLVLPDVALRAGAGYVALGASTAAGSSSENSVSYLTVPLTVSYLGFGSARHVMEVGGGVTIRYATDTVSAGMSEVEGGGLSPYGVAFVGYRLHAVGGPGPSLRAGVLVLAGQGLSLRDPEPDEVGVLPWGYLSFGATF